MRTAIATDSNSGITQEQAEKLGIYVLPMPFMINGEMFYEGVNLTHEEFFRQMEEGADITMAPLSLSIACHIGPGSLAVACSGKLKELE